LLRCARAQQPAMPVVGVFHSALVAEVLHLLKRTQHNVSKAARLAGIDRNYLRRMMKKHGIVRKE